jgi:ferredoxin
MSREQEAPVVLRVEVDSDRCQGHARCWSICPEVFSLDDDGYAFVRDAAVPSEFEESVAKAAATCPERAIQTTQV